MDAGIPLINGLPQFPGQIGPVNVQGDITATGNITAGGQLAGASGNISGNLTVGGNVTVTGTISASGLNDTQARNARAPRQGLIFDGAYSSYATLSSATASFGLGDLTASVIVRCDEISQNPPFIYTPGTTQGPCIRILSNGSWRVGKDDAGAVANYTANAPAGSIVNGKTYNLVWVRSNGVSTIYQDGIQVGQAADTLNLTSGFSYIGSYGAASTYFKGAIDSFLVYNRALSASEVQALYDTAAPSAADYNNATNTNAATNWTNSGVPYDSFSAASATGFTAVSNGAGDKIANISPTTFPIVKGTKWRVTCTLTLNSGTAPSISFGSTVVANLASNVQQLSAGLNTFELTVTKTTSSSTLYCYNNSTASNFSISGFSLTPLGLLLAPEIPAPGNGLLWNDQSGNGTTIVLSTSGISWNCRSNAENRVRAQTNTNGNQQLLGATCLPPYVQITRVRARSLTGTPNVKLATTSGGNDIVTTVALSTSWKTLALNLTDPTGSSNTNLWANSNSTDTVQWDISWEPIAAL